MPWIRRLAVLVLLILIILAALLVYRWARRKGAVRGEHIAGGNDVNKVKLRVRFGGKVIREGTRISPKEAVLPPDVSLEDDVAGEASTAYTIIMVDPDAPSRKDPSAAEWRHWMVTNVPRGRGGELLAEQGSLITPYQGPEPPAGSGPHRYFIKVYSGAKNLTAIAKERARWDSSAFAQQNGLTEVASVFFVTEAPN